MSEKVPDTFSFSKPPTFEPCRVGQSATVHHAPDREARFSPAGRRGGTGSVAYSFPFVPPTRPRSRFEGPYEKHLAENVGILGVALAMRFTSTRGGGPGNLVWPRPTRVRYGWGRRGQTSASSG